MRGTFAAVGAAIILVTILVMFIKMTGKNDDQNWQVHQSITGAVSVIDGPGYYMNNFGSVWTWPRADQAEFENIKVTFNDGGNATMKVMIRYQLPVEETLRRELHREFAGDVENVKKAIGLHVVNVMSATGPMMSASEHQSARKGEFTQLTLEQTQKGLYQMRRTEKEIDMSPEVPVAPLLDEKGNPIQAPTGAVPQQPKQVVKVLANDIILDKNGQPVIANESPLKRYGITITQLSMGDPEYDPQVVKQFEAKKEAFLRAEQAKAQRQNEVEQTLMVVQQGLREKAEVEAVANKEKARAVIAGEQQAEVALQLKLKNVTDATAKFEVAQQERHAAVEKANQELDIARLKASAAEQEALAIRTLAAAEEEKIAKAGAITEKERVLAEIEQQTRIGVAQHLAQIRTPQVVMAGGTGADGQSASFQDQLINMTLLNQLGVIQKPDPVQTAVISQQR